jgi:hypothetical protein
MAEVARVLVTGGLFLASSHGPGPDHPIKAIVDDVAREHGWRPPGWYAPLKRDVGDVVARPDALVDIAERAGFASARATVHEVELAELDPIALVTYRLGMGTLAAFTTELDPAARVTVVAEAVARLGPDPEPFRASVTTLRATTPATPRRPG